MQAMQVIPKTSFALMLMAVGASFVLGYLYRGFTNDTFSIGRTYMENFTWTTSNSRQYEDSERQWVVHPPVSVKSGIIGYYEENFKNPCYFEGPGSGENLRCLPYFYMIGIGKSGTTTLCDCLGHHPDIVSPSTKEIGYWDNGPRDHDHVVQNYIPKFKRASVDIYNSTIEWAGYSEYHHKITYDCTPRNAWYLSFLPRSIYGLYKRTRIIIIMRNPTDRVFSLYHHDAVRLGMKFSPEAFHAGVQKEITHLRQCQESESIVACVSKLHWTTVNVHFSIYYAYVKVWLEQFSPNQLLLVKAEELYSNSTNVMDGVFRFLQLDPPSAEVSDNINKVQHHNNPPGIGVMINRNMPEVAASIKINNHTNEEKLSLKSKAKARWDAYKDKMLPETRQLLDEFYAPYNKMLADLVQDDRFLFVEDEVHR